MQVAIVIGHNAPIDLHMPMKVRGKVIFLKTNKAYKNIIEKEKLSLFNILPTNFPKRPFSYEQSSRYK